MASADTLHAPSPALFSVPLLGPVARVLTRSDVLPLLVILLLLVLWGAAVALFGLPALYLPAVVASPLVLVVLVLISIG